jgi:transposase
MSLLTLSSSSQYYMYNGTVDMRKSFKGLTGIIRGELGRDPLSGDVFIFFNRHRDQVKLLQFEGDGYGIFYKRLEQGTFELPVCCSDQADALISWQDLQFVLQGVDLKTIRFRKRYRRHAPAA